MSTLYLHIGTPKTGTTALQIFLKKNNSVLKEKNCVYPDFKVRFKNVRPQRNGHFLIPTVKDEEMKEACFRRIFQLSEKYSKIILSDEELWNACGDSVGFWTALKNKLNSEGITLKVIVYLRRQDEYFASHWAQKIKGVKAKTFTFDEFIKSHADSKIILNYYSCLQGIAHIIGAENLIVRPYEFCQFINQSIIDDFLDAVKIKNDKLIESDTLARNISLEGNVLEVKRYLNMIPKFAKRGTSFQSCLVEVQNQLKKSGDFRNCSTFVKDQRQTFLQKYTEGNEKIAREFLGFEDGLLFKNPLPQKDPPRRNYSKRELKKIINITAEVNKNFPSSPFSEEEFLKISQKAMDIIDKEKSLSTKIKSTLKALSNFNIYAN